MRNSESFSCICRLFPGIWTSKKLPPARRKANMADSLCSWQQKQLVSSDGVLLQPPLTDYNDILVEILSRLPVKSLLQVRCVCKSWHTLISDPHFVMKHLNRAVTYINNTNSFTLFLSSTRIQSVVSIAFDKDHNDDAHVHVTNRELDYPVMIPDIVITRIMGSCNGLICLQVNCTNIIIWNPCTGHSKVLPKTSSLHHGSRFYGFGYDSTTDDYKVIQGSTIALGSNKETVIEVFSLKTNSWRRSKEDQELNIVYLNRKGCFLNGALHWLELQWADLLPIGSRILSFDLAEEKFREIVPLPYLGNKNYVFVGIGTSRNRLFVYSNAADTDVIRIWAMKDYGVRESWVKVTKIPSEILLEGHVSCLKPLCILENGEILMDFNRNFLVLYNPKEKTYRKIAITMSFEVAMYTETLVSPATGGARAI